MNDRFKFRVWKGEKYKYDIQYDEVPIAEYEDGWGYTIEQCTGLKDKNDKLIYEGILLN